MTKQSLHFRTELCEFDRLGNVEQLRAMAVLVLVEENAKFVEISEADGNKNVLLIASYDPRRGGVDKDFVFATP